MIGDNLQKYTYEYLMQLALSFVPDDRDKREGSVIYDALAPFCQLLAAGALELKNFCTETYAVTATGQDLDNRVAERGITRHPATYAVKKIVLADALGNPVVVPPGTRFSTVSDTNPVNYMVTAQYVENGVPVAGSYEATCEELGVVGNEYSGSLINITFIQGIATAYMSATLVPARDEETDEELRQRYFQALNEIPFGGNVSDYRTKVRAIVGVGDVQVYPTWNGGGTVKLSVVDPSYGPCSAEFVAAVQSEVDPENSEGQKGVGIGIAPIGHQVTVVTPEEITVDVSATVTLRSGYALGQIEGAVQQVVTEYIQSLRHEWAEPNDTGFYICEVLLSRILATIISVPGVSNVTNVLLNGVSQDLILTQSKDVQQLPRLGEVSLNV